MRHFKPTLFFALALFMVMACGKDKPKAPAFHDAAGAEMYFKKFTFSWVGGLGSDVTGGKAQYAQSPAVQIGNRTDAKAKVDLFLYDDQTYALELWQLAFDPAAHANQLQGAIVTGSWRVNDNSELSLVDTGNKKVAVGTAVKSPNSNSEGGISLKLDSGFDFKKLGNQALIQGTFSDPFVLTYLRKEDANRTLPPNKKDGLIRQMQVTNSHSDWHEFKD